MNNSHLTTNTSCLTFCTQYFLDLQSTSHDTTYNR